MADFEAPADLRFNRGLIADPQAFAREASATPRPTLVTCRTGPRSSALVYLYAGLRSGASGDEVLACAEANDAPFTHAEELKAWVAQGLGELS